MNVMNYVLSALAAISIMFQFRAMRQKDKLTNIALMIATIMLLCTNFIIMAINIK